MLQVYGTVSVVEPHTTYMSAVELCEDVAALHRLHAVPGLTDLVYYTRRNGTCTAPCQSKLLPVTRPLSTVALLDNTYYLEFSETTYTMRTGDIRLDFLWWDNAWIWVIMTVHWIRRLG